MEEFLRGGALGLSIAVPIGPIATICINRTLARGRLAGIVTGLGTATVHAAYGTMAVLGGEAGGKSLHIHADTMHRMGGLLLCLVGFVMLKRTFAPPIFQERNGGFLADYASAAAIAVFNPMTLAMFVGGISAFGVEAANPIELVLGVVVASASWYTAMCLFVGAVGHRLPPRIMRRVNGISALAVCAMGAVAVVEAL